MSVDVFYPIKCLGGIIWAWFFRDLFLPVSPFDFVDISMKYIIQLLIDSSPLLIHYFICCHIYIFFFGYGRSWTILCWPEARIFVRNTYGFSNVFDIKDLNKKKKVNAITNQLNLKIKK